MKQLLLSTLLICTFAQIRAQSSLTLQPDVVELDVDRTQFETVAHSWVTNTSDTVKTFRWTRSIESMTEGWANAICDRNACYSTDTDSTPDAFLLELAAGDSSMIDVHIRPNGIEGQAVVKVTVFEVDDPDNRVEGTYRFNQTTPTSDVNLDVIKLFPNPTTEYFELSEAYDVARVIVYNLGGRQMKSFISYPGAKFMVAELPRGMYLVRLIDRQRGVLKTLRLTKR